VTRKFVNSSKPGALWSLRLLLTCSLLLLVPLVAFPHKALADPLTASDNFSRADGPLGPNWADVSDGGLAISSGAVIGKAGQVTGDTWIADTFTSDQFSQVQVTSTQLSGTQWIGPAVRMQNGGQTGYVGIYYWNSGSPELMLFKRVSGGWAQVGNVYNSGPLAAGTQLELQAVGSTISFLDNGTQVISVTDSGITGGAPGIMAYGAAEAGNWSGGDTANYTVGGTVSGLSGTVVLQDNGGDNLSVSANGSFTFATALASGAAYSVTVKTNPTGQSCTVSSGSGTVGSANVASVAVSCATNSATSASDDFSRANGPLGPNWADISDGGLAISSGAVIGKAGQVTGDTWIADTFTSDQYSQVQVTSTQLSGIQWIGPAVRMQNNGQTGYVGLYNWNNGSPVLELFKRASGSWAQIGAAYSTSPLAAGTQLELQAVGSTIYFMENGIVVVTATDSSVTGGAPGIAAYGNAEVGSWSGGDASIPRFQATYMSTDANGIASYQVISSDNGYGPQEVRVLKPTNPAPGVAHNFLFVLPVELGLGTTYGDGMQTMLSANAQNQYNLTIIEPTFGTDPWYADNPTDPNMQYETYVTQDLVPWVEKNLGTSGSEQNWLIGFSKSGYGAQDLILKHPGVFSLAASWDFPADMSSYNSLGADSASNYGTDANFQSNYRLTQAFVDAHKAPFLSSNRIWIGGYSEYQPDMTDYGALLTSEGIAHSTETPQQMDHAWGSGWVPIALAALYQDSTNLGS
jgi:K+-transporting ATPase c subunit